MHIPENYLSPQTCGVMLATVAPVWYVSIKKVDAQIKLHKETIPMLGLSSSLSFLIMMFNLPVPGGTTAHAVGAVLLAILSGPWAACLSVSVALLLQSLLFGDGGILAFGANCFTMAVVMPFVGYGIYLLLKKHAPKIGAFLAAYVGVNAAALATAILLGVQPLLFHDAARQPLYNPYPLNITIPAMMSVHLLVIGFVEGIFTLSVLSFVKRSTQTDTFTLLPVNTRRLKFILIGFVLLSPLGLLASGTAWGEWDLNELVKTLKDNHLPTHKPQGMVHGLSFHSLFSDYTIPGLPISIGYILCGITAILVFLLLYRLLFERRNKNA
ncbi:cobalt transporter CbiM [Enterococcus saigonensis]|uniref:Cobalt transporter CbiM n=1 Tax=Enterococcus saigonensis TaxID=1805431 RepID=A0A679IS65_9ENTE|nr:cobalt transporter CbiM [Enterococcus saigonensis]BCA87034.1 cobalt transporter CbiM [Enterococcus saigonensis]